MKVYLGNYVVSKGHRHYGRVYAKHSTFSRTNETDEWFEANKANNPHITVKDQRWYSVLVHGGGSVLIADSDIELVSATPLEQGFENAFEGEYFDIVRPVKNESLAELFDTFKTHAEGSLDVLRRITMEEDVDDDGLTEEESEEVDHYLEEQCDAFEGHVGEASWGFLSNERKVIRYIIGDTGFIFEEDDIDDIV